MALGKLNLKLGIDVSDLDKELGKVERTMSRFGGKMQNIGTTLTQSLTLPIIGLGAASLKSFADIEKLQNGLIAIMGSSEDAAVEMEKLRKANFATSCVSIYPTLLVSLVVQIACFSKIGIAYWLINPWKKPLR